MAPTNKQLQERVKELEAQVAASGGEGSDRPAHHVAPYFQGAPALEDLPQAAVDRLEAIASKLDDRDHLRDCPVPDDEVPNVEAYGVTIPAKDDAPRRSATVVRCLTCGGSAVDDTPYEDFVAALPAGE